MTQPVGGYSNAGGEFFRHQERADGTRDLFFGELGSPDHGHAVIDQFGRPKFLRESDGRTVCDDSFGR